MKTKAKTREQLERELIETRAQLKSSYVFALKDLPKAADLRASGVLVTLTAVGGRQITPPFVVKDGLSDETIKALSADIQRSLDD